MRSAPQFEWQLDHGCGQTTQVPSRFADLVNNLDEEAFQSLYGRWQPLEPAAIAELLAGSSIRWYIAGGRAARVGAPPRHHEDTDLVVRLADLGQLREVLADWDLWEAHSGWLRPLLPGLGLGAGHEQLWARLDSQHPWQLDILLDRSADEWTFKRDASVRVPWERAVHDVGGIPHLRPEIALLHKAHLDRPKDRDDLAVAVLDRQSWDWLAEACDRLGYQTWAQLVRDRANSLSCKVRDAEPR